MLMGIMNTCIILDDINVNERGLLLSLRTNEQNEEIREQQNKKYCK